MTFLKYIFTCSRKNIGSHMQSRWNCGQNFQYIKGSSSLNFLFTQALSIELAVLAGELRSLYLRKHMPYFHTRGKETNCQ